LLGIFQKTARIRIGQSNPINRLSIEFRCRQQGKIVAHRKELNRRIREITGKCTNPPSNSRVETQRSTIMADSIGLDLDKKVAALRRRALGRRLAQGAGGAEAAEGERRGGSAATSQEPTRRVGCGPVAAGAKPGAALAGRQTCGGLGGICRRRERSISGWARFARARTARSPRIISEAISRSLTRETRSAIVGTLAATGRCVGPRLRRYSPGARTASPPGV
jgi:hypothetical protein